MAPKTKEKHVIDALLFDNFCFKYLDRDGSELLIYIIEFWMTEWLRNFVQ